MPPASSGHQEAAFKWLHRSHTQLCNMYKNPKEIPFCFEF